MGYAPGFLGIPVALPGLDQGMLLDYVHFSVVLDTTRRLARSTGVNVDGASLVDLERADDWRLDERVPVAEQTGPEVYARNVFDRGHLVRRRDPVWGVDAAAANSDTFHYTNAAPQAGEFNQSKELWLGLEDHVLAFATVNRLRLNVFTAPVLADDDPPYRGIRLPLRFWKVVAWRAGERLAAAGFVLDQTPLIRDAEHLRAIDEPPELGPFRTFQVPIIDIAATSGIELDELARADRMPQTVAAAGWRLLTSGSDILL